VIKAGNKSLGGSGFAAQFANKSLKLLAVNPATGSSLNVLVAGAGGMTSDELPQLQGTFKQQVERVGATGVAFKKATVAGEPAIRASYLLKIQGNRLPTVQYLTVHDDSVYTVTLAGHFKMSAKVEKEIIGSWRFL